MHGTKDDLLGSTTIDAGIPVILFCASTILRVGFESSFADNGIDIFCKDRYRLVAAPQTVVLDATLDQRRITTLDGNTNHV